MCVFDRTENRTLKLEEVTSMQLSCRITVARNIRILYHSLLYAKHKNAVVLGLEAADGMVKTTFNQESDSTYFTWHPISI